MTEQRILILGNSGSGKTTMARALVAERGLAHLDLDSIAWATPGERLPLTESVAALHAFHRSQPAWVIEGSYASLALAACALCTEFRFLDPGIEACAANCQRRPWEPEKYATPEEQDARLPFLLDWVRSYDVRDDEYGRCQHRALFDAFDGAKREYGGS